jgi:hypothetical protein
MDRDDEDIQQIISNARALCDSIFSGVVSKLERYPNAENLAIALRMSVRRYDINETLRS